jgi:hypothetical protein
MTWHALTQEGQDPVNPPADSCALPYPIRSIPALHAQPTGQAAAAAGIGARVVRVTGGGLLS